MFLIPFARYVFFCVLKLGLIFTEFAFFTRFRAHLKGTSRAYLSMYEL